MKLSIRIAIAVAALIYIAPVAVAAPINPAPNPCTFTVCESVAETAPINPAPNPCTFTVCESVAETAPINPAPNPCTFMVCAAEPVDGITINKSLL